MEGEDVRHPSVVLIKGTKKNKQNSSAGAANTAQYSSLNTTFRSRNSVSYDVVSSHSGKRGIGNVPRARTGPAQSAPHLSDTHFR
jgi:hypothetical protein